MCQREVIMCEECLVEWAEDELENGLCPVCLGIEGEDYDPADIDPSHGAWDDEDDGQPDEYTEWQDYMGGDDWDHGQYDEY